MNKDINKRLEELNINIENASVPAGSYIPYVISNNLVFISGQLPFINGELTLKGKIGDNVSINRRSLIHAGGGVEIANNVLIGPGVVIYSQNHNFHQKDININIQGFNTEVVIINENVWVGARSIILPGVTIGSNSIIGAGSVVKKDVEANTIVAGNPAKFIRYR